MPKEPELLRDVIAADMTIWVFCLFCSHAQLVHPRFLHGKTKGEDDSLTMLAHLFRCGNCKRKGVKLIPTPRTMISFDKMGLARE
jgi:hypothetical protein